MPWYLDQISNCTYRQFTTGFFFGKPDENTQIYDSNTYNKEYTYLGIVHEVRDGLCRIEQRNKFSVGEMIEIMRPDGRNVEVQVKRILNEEGERAGERAPLKTGAVGGTVGSAGGIRSAAAEGVKFLFSGRADPLMNLAALRE